MKGSALAAAAAMAGSAAAARLGNRHAAAHDLFRKDEGTMCVPECSTIYSTFYGEPTMQFEPAPEPTLPVAESTPPPAETEPVAEAPTPTPITVTTPGTYTIPATTITLTATTTVCGAETTHLTPGTHTIGGVTTVVETPGTVTVPVAVIETSNGIPTSIISSTVYFCPSAGTYTIAPTTTAVPTEGDVTYPVPTEYPPGTYTRPEIVTTITETSTVFYCPYTSSGLTPEPTPEPEPTSAPEPTTEVPAPITTPEPEPTTTPEPAPASSEPASSKSPTSSSPASAPTGGLGGGNHYGMTYTPYTSDKDSRCKTADEVDADIKEISDAGFNVIRVYSTECDTLPNVGAACSKYGLKMILGVFIKEDGCSADTTTISEQIDAIAAWANWGLVSLIAVGNEAVLSGKCSVDQLAGVLTVTKEKCKAAGYTGPFTVAETTGVWGDTSKASVLCDLVDVVGGNIHPFFNTETSAENAGTFTAGQLQLLDGVCPGKTSINLECGWPTAGNCQGAACPGVEQQATAISSIIKECGSLTVFFSFGNDLWKEPGACACENSWGCGSLFQESSFIASIQ